MICEGHMKYRLTKWGGADAWYRISFQGVTYFRRWGFSINEGEFPNIHVSWRRDGFLFYLAFSWRWKVIVSGWRVVRFGPWGA